ncbi:MAG: phosphoribosylaminoimidazolesuccinocarboxamide synthase [Candidatus Paceibacterota bacterium]
MMKALMDIELPLPKIHSGKVREIFDPTKLMNEYGLPGQYELHVNSDRVSVDDVVMLTGIPCKGEALHRINMHWTNLLLNARVCPIDYVAGNLIQFPGPLQELLEPYRNILHNRTMLVRKGLPFGAESIVRWKLRGSGFRDYKAKDGVVGGIQLPPGLKEGDTLPAPIFTPSTKAAGGEHDLNISFAELIDMVGESSAQLLQAYSLAVFSIGQVEAMRLGIVIDDTKFEFMRFLDGSIGIGDERFTPDSTRFSPAVIDKQDLRDWLHSSVSGFNGQDPIELPAAVARRGTATYVRGCEMITGYRII